MTQGCVMTLTQGHISNNSAYILKIRVLPAKFDLDNISRTYCRPWQKVLSLMSRLQCMYPNPCPGHNPWLPSRILIIFHKSVDMTKDVSWPWPKVISPRSRPQCSYDPVSSGWVCHDLVSDPRSYLYHVNVTVHVPKIRVRAITPHCHVGSG